MEHYEELRVLGTGSFGVASLVRRRRDGALLVAKRMRMCGIGSKEREDAINEANCLSKIQHPYVTAYHESLCDKGFLCIIMEFAPNGDLGARLRKQKSTPGAARFPDDLAMRWVVQLLVALDFIHEECRILHRDLKPQNLFLDGDDGIKVGDLGIAKALDKTLDMARTVVGTPYYMSPELCRNERYAFKSDMWALGCIAYEICSLRRPFEGANLSALVLQIVTAMPRPLTSRTASAPLAHKLIQNLLDKDSASRPSARELLLQPALRSWAQSYTHANNIPALSSLLPPASTSAPNSSTAASTKPKGGNMAARFAMYGGGKTGRAKKASQHKKPNGQGKCGDRAREAVVGSFVAGLVGIHKPTARDNEEKKAQRGAERMAIRGDGNKEETASTIQAVALEPEQTHDRGADEAGGALEPHSIEEASGAGPAPPSQRELVRHLCAEKKTREMVLARQREAHLCIETRLAVLRASKVRAVRSSKTGGASKPPGVSALRGMDSPRCQPAASGDDGGAVLAQTVQPEGLGLETCGPHCSSSHKAKTCSIPEIVVEEEEGVLTQSVVAVVEEEEGAQLVNQDAEEALSPALLGEPVEDLVADADLNETAILDEQIESWEAMLQDLHQQISEDLAGLDSTSRALDEAERQLRLRSTSPKIDERRCSLEAVGQSQQLHMGCEKNVNHTLLGQGAGQEPGETVKNGEVPRLHDDSERRSGVRVIHGKENGREEGGEQACAKHVGGRAEARVRHFNRRACAVLPSGSPRLPSSALNSPSPALASETRQTDPPGGEHGCLLREEYSLMEARSREAQVESETHEGGACRGGGGGLWGRMQTLALDLKARLGRKGLEEAYLAAKTASSDADVVMIIDDALASAGRVCAYEERTKILDSLRTLIFCEENFSAGLH